MLMQAAQWEPISSNLARYSLLWLGHVSRMSVDRRPKQLLFGWWEDHARRPSAPKGQTQWLNKLIEQAGIPALDWFRLAQDTGAWIRLVNAAYPAQVIIV